MRSLLLLIAANADVVKFEAQRPGDVHCGCTLGHGETAFRDFVKCAQANPSCDEYYAVMEVGTHQLDTSDGDTTELRLKQDFVAGSYLAAVAVYTTDGSPPGNVTVSIGPKTQINISDCVSLTTEYTCCMPLGLWSDDNGGAVIKIAAANNNLDVTRPVQFTKNFGKWPQRCPIKPFQTAAYFTSRAGETFCGCTVGESSAYDTFAKFADCIAAAKDCKGDFSVTNIITYAALAEDVIDFTKIRIPRPYAKGAHVIKVVMPATGPVVAATVSAANKVLCFDEFNYSSGGQSPKVTVTAHPCSNSDRESDYLELMVRGGTMAPELGFFRVESVVGKYDAACPAP